MSPEPIKKERVMSRDFLFFSTLVLPFPDTCNNKSLQNTPPYEIHYKNGDFTQSYSSGSVSVDYNFPSKVTNGIHHHQWNIRSPENTLINITFFRGQPYNLNPTVNISCLSRKGNLQVSHPIYFLLWIENVH